MAVLREFPGDGAVNLRLANNGSVTALVVPNVRTGPELRERLIEVVGEEGLTWETTDGA
jgi:hypothetical protein